MVLCKDIGVGDDKCYEYEGTYLGKFVKKEVKLIKGMAPDYYTVYTFENPRKKTMNNMISFYGHESVKVITCRPLKKGWR
jgi:hypothetical protein